MKKLFSFWFVLVLSGDVYCQFVWVNDNLGNFEQASQLIQSKGGYYAILHGSTYNDELSIIDGVGNKIFHFKYLPPANFVNYLLNGIVDMPDSTIALAVRGQGIDTNSGDGWEISYFLKFDHNWNKTQLSIDYYSPYQRIIKPLTDGSLVILDGYDKKVFLTVPNGNSIWETTLNDYTCRDMLVTPSDSILIATQQGLLTMDNAGNIVSIHPELVFGHIKLDGSGRIVGTAADSITLLSQDYGQLASVILTNEVIKDFAVKDDTVAILTASDNVLVYHNDLSLVSEFGLEGEEEYKFIGLGNSRITLAGDELYGDKASTNYTTATFLKQYTIDGLTPMSGGDIGVTGMDLGSSVSIQQVGLPNMYRVAFPNASISVHNYGEDLVSKFNLRSQEVRTVLDGMNILPGEELNVPWPDLFFYSNEYPAGLTYDVCVWTSHPNFSLDADAGNDTYCVDFFVSNEEVVESPEMVIFPNPSSDIVVFQLNGQRPSHFNSFRILNVYGYAIEEIVLINNETSFIVNVNDWPPGVYFLQLLEDGNTIATERFVVISR